MPCTIGYWHFAANTSGMILKLYGADGIVNGSGDTLALEDEEEEFYFLASVAETIAAGVYRARIMKGASCLYSGLVRISGTGKYDIDDHTVQAVTEFSTAALAQIGGLNAILISVPSLVGAELSHPIIQGDCYLNSHNRAIKFTRSDFPDLAGTEVVTMTLRITTPEGVESYPVTGTIEQATGSKILRFEPTSEQTAEWSPGRYEFDVQVAFAGGNVVTFYGPNIFLRVINRTS